MTKYLRNKIKDNVNQIHKILLSECATINKSISKRSRLLTFKDILYFMCLKNGNNQSYSLVNSFIKSTNLFNVSDGALSNWRKKIDVSYINTINDKLLNYIYKDNRQRFIAVDGSQLNFRKKISNSGYALSKSGHYSIGLLSSLFDVNTQIPINYKLFNHKNERDALIDQLAYVKPNDVLIFDRGYYSANLLEILNQKKIHSIFRIKHNSQFAKLLTDTNSSDMTHFIKINDENKKIRVVKFNIDKKVKNKIVSETYYILTTLTDGVSINSLKDLYHKRWNIETNFRHLKYNLSLFDIQSKTKLNIEQDLAIHNFIFIIDSYFEYLLTTCLSKTNYKINTKKCLNLTINKLLELLLYKSNHYKITNKIIDILGIVFSTPIKIIINRHYRRVRYMPTSKWGEGGNTFKYRFRKK